MIHCARPVDQASESSLRIAIKRKSERLPVLMRGPKGRVLGRARTRHAGRVGLVRNGIRLGFIDPVDLGDEAAVDFACVSLERIGWRLEDSREFHEIDDGGDAA